jgi:SAM-dependent methyltransferase
VPSSFDRCTACGDARVRRDPFHYRWRGRRYDILRCVACTHQFVHPPVSADDQRLMYDDAYFAAKGDWACGHFAGAAYLDAEDRLRAEATHVLGRLPTNRGRLLDVGCAGGVFLDEARRRGFSAAGIELNPAMARHARERYGLDVINSRVEDVPASQWNQSFDVVTFLDCLEHLPAPLATMRAVARWLRPGGVVFIRGPLSNSRLGRAKEAIRRLTGVPKRLPGYPLDASMFNRRSLTAMLECCDVAPTEWYESHEFAEVVAHRRP